MRAMISSAAAAMAAVLCTGCPLVELEAEIGAVCSTRHDLAIEAAPAGLAPAAVELEVDVALELAELELLAQLDPEIRFAHVRLRPTSGIDDLGFVDAARLTVASGDPASTLPTLDLVECAGNCPRDGLDLLLPSDLDADAMDYATAGPLVVGATIGGALPTVAWTLDVEVCAAGRASF